MTLITLAYKNFPLLEYQNQIRHAIEVTTDEHFQETKWWKAPPSTGGVKKKDYPISSALQRLQLMKAEVVLAVIERLHLALWKTKTLEDSKASTDVIKAAAQHRIILPNADQDTVASLVHWVYNSELQFLNAAHLYRIYGMAECLGMQELAEDCLSKLSIAASTAIDDAQIAGVPLQDLLDGITTDGDAHEANNLLSDVVRTVFTSVVQQKQPPAVLKHLVIEAVANSSDPSLVETLLLTMASRLKDELCMALSSRLFELKKTMAKQKGAHNSDSSTNGSVKSEIPSSFNTDMKDNAEIASNGTATDYVATHGNGAGKS
jgi:hypothetical protein